MHDAEEMRIAADLTRAAYDGKLLPARQLPLFRNQGWAFAQRKIERGDTVQPLPKAATTLDDVVIAANGGPASSRCAAKK